MVLYEFEECHLQKNPHTHQELMEETQRRDRNKGGNEALEAASSLLQPDGALTVE